MEYEKSGNGRKILLIVDNNTVSVCDGNLQFKFPKLPNGRKFHFYGIIVSRR